MKESKDTYVFFMKAFKREPFHLREIRVNNFTYITRVKTCWEE